AAMRVAADEEVLQDARMLEELDVLKGAGDAAAGDLVRRRAGDVLVLEDDAPRRALVDAAHQVEDRALAGAVGADDGEDLALLHLEADAVDRLDAAEMDGEILRREEGHLRRSERM